MTPKTSATKERPPIIAVMGHIDHGKSTLLDYIRKANTVADEAGGITQHISAYEVVRTATDGSEKRITFLDTPGHEAFSGMRARGATVADIAILIVSAEDGVKPQTLEALQSIRDAGTPFVVAINKIDKPDANPDKVKQDLMEHGVYVEGYGGDVPAVAISAVTGQGVDELLDTVLLVAEMEELAGDPLAPAEGVVVESHLDPKKGASATLVITNGTLRKGMYAVAENTLSPVRILEDFGGEAIDEASFSSPVVVTGWNSVPRVGSEFSVFENKKDAERAVADFLETAKKREKLEIKKSTETETVIPLLVKTDVAGTLEAIEKEIGKVKRDNVTIQIVQKNVGNITEGDIKLISVAENPIVIGFHVSPDTRARDAAERMGVEIKTFDIIYKITEYLEEVARERAPKILTEETTGEAKILRVFSRAKNKQVVGGRVLSGNIRKKSSVKILRRENEIGKGEIVELQRQKTAADSVAEDEEFGAMISSPIEIAEGDRIIAFTSFVR